MIAEFINVILHVDKYLSSIIGTYSIWTYAILFVIVFLETGFVVTPFLPGDSLLFAVGSFAALGSLNLSASILLLTLAAIIGDTANYYFGYYLGPKVFKKENARFFKKEYLDRTKEFYDLHGKKSIFLGRFIPIIRTFVPFIAGIGKMNYLEFLKYNLLGGIVWVLLFTLGGYFFGNISFVKENFSFVILGIIIISFLPILFEIMKSRRVRK
ncbi:DedA family protein [Candidatus Woesearchaeota archaeon]|nr:DedA family protein [Candidatus Woesearchaeota archaeon]